MEVSQPSIPLPQEMLVIDDDESIRNAVADNLISLGVNVKTSSSTEEALSLVERSDFDVVLCDFKLGGLSGIDFLERCKQVRPFTAVILTTAYGNQDLALEALRKGAVDYITKPFSMEELVLTLAKYEERERLKAENQALRKEVEGENDFSKIITASPAMLDIIDSLKRLANFNSTILVTGESGTGKEILARAIHKNSGRGKGPFIPINCGAIPENLIESELFGHTKGAFTDAVKERKGLFQEAHGGTLFLDEIGELPLHLQVKLLRVLQERSFRPVGGSELIDVDIRLIAATHRNLESDVSAGKFREDLFYRLNVVGVHIPPLRERIEDIEVLAKHFLKKFNRKFGSSVTKIEEPAWKALLAYTWKGNVRELENCIERAVILAETDSVSLELLPPKIRNAATEEDSKSLLEAIPDENLSIKERSKALEIDLIKKALQQTQGNRTHAAKLLEISHRALLYKIKEYNL